MDDSQTNRGVPSLIGPYRLLDQIGEGGMGVVYRAIHAETRQEVAIKMVRSLTPNHLAALRDEVVALKRIRHAGVISIVDEGLSDGLPWYAMELLKGTTLAAFNQRIWGDEDAGLTRTCSTDVPDDATLPGRALHPVPRVIQGPRRPLSAEQAAEVFGLYRGICAALAHIHRRGMVHRDLKPSNVLLKSDWGPVLMDFGLATRADGAIGREALTSDLARGRAGTAAYMAPEQIRGEVVDARADLYSLGCMIYESLCGHSPFGSLNRNKLLSAHLADIAPPLSEVLADVSPLLDSLLKRLLAKLPQERLGYAEDVDALLAELGGRRPPGYPDASAGDVPYIYRPRLVGRSDTLDRIDHHLTEASAGRGGLLLLGGESGIGKTFLATEVSHRASTRGFTVLTGDCLPAAGSSSEGEPAAATNAPLQPFRRLLQFVGDRCRHQGRTYTDHLLGGRGKVLARYEPSLAFAPGQDLIPDPADMVPAAARQRVFEALSETIARLSEEQPLLWLLDDMQWADDMTLSFLVSPTSRLLEDRRILVLATFRSDEPKEAVTAVVQHPRATVINLGRLDGPAVSALAADMLGMPAAPPFLATFLSRSSEGNPFFVAEYLRVAVSENLLRRHAGRWELSNRDDSAAAADISERLPLSRSIHELIGRRFDDLGTDAIDVVAGAAVIGREFEVDLLGQILASSTGKQPKLLEILEDLRRRQILEPWTSARQRFSHDKIREVAYDRIPEAGRRRLHSIVARVLELRIVWSTEQPSLYPQLAHHLTRAGQFHRGADHFLRAARRARTAFANEDALRFFRAAIANLNRALSAPPSSPVVREMLVAANEEMGEVLSLVGSHDSAVAAFASGLALCSPSENLLRARLNRRIGKARAGQNEYAEALGFFSNGEQLLATHGANVSPLHWREWTEIQLERIWAYYWTGDTKALGSAIETLAPVVERHGTSAQRAVFYQAHCLADMRRSRYRVSPTTLALIRGAAREANSLCTIAEAASVNFIFAFALMFFGNLAEARAEMAKVLDAATRLGDPLLKLRALTYLAVVFRQQGDVGRSRELSLEVIERATAQGAFHYLGAAQANLGWALYSLGLVPDAEPHLQAALESWKSAPTVYPFQDLALWPLAAILFETGRREAAQALLAQLSDESQRQFSSALDSLLQQSRSSSRIGEDATRERFRDLLAVARNEGLY
jgi:serine/threonine protein kinase/tetratricopeptide (TPR) repeat protein